jgi:hypothetical protein
MERIVHFMLVSDRDMKHLRVAKAAHNVTIDRGEICLGALDASRYFTSEPRSLCDPSRKPWFIMTVDWTDEEGVDRSEKIATNTEEWTYVKQSLGRTRIPFTDAVKYKIQNKIERFWRSV